MRGIEKVATWACGILISWLLVAAVVMFIGSLIGCSHIPPLPDLPGSITNAIPGVPTTSTATTTTTVPPAVGAYTITKVTASMIYWKGPDLTWPENGDLCGESHLYRADGRGGKFDHVRRNTKSRDWKNIHPKTVTDANGKTHVEPAYGVWATVGEPADGETCTLTLHSYDGKHSVKVGDFPWVR
jgi:hypothetical protein